MRRGDGGPTITGLKFRYVKTGKPLKTKSKSRGTGLLGADQLAKKPGALAVLVEGEKDMWNGLTNISDLAWLSPACGAKQRLADYAPLFAGHEVAVLYDADEDGKAAAPKRAAERGRIVAASADSGRAVSSIGRWTTAPAPRPCQLPAGEVGAAILRTFPSTGVSP